ncbi:PTS system fructose-specific EIIABC component [Crateriforma conspicua]|uniref:PTS system fructose-specific EIIABC component n=2 Tax=Planctomycetaceae TaxID=126 RepID=A0A5C6FWW0_9PLAN|nr:PTS system fructose-specific EIIABC component [Crateriforma conspicua]
MTVSTLAASNVFRLRYFVPSLSTQLLPFHPADRTMDVLDVDKLAEYLHLTPAQVNKMANRGKLPGRKVGGQWQFNEAEIHHWLEERIGLSDDDELDKVEALLERNHGDAGDATLSQLCPPSNIAVPLQARTRSSVIRSMCDLAATSGYLWDAATMSEAVKTREELHPTALDCGVALLHPRRPQTSILAESVLALGICSAGIPFSSGRGQLTDVFFLICSYNDSAHLRILAKLSRLVSQPDFLAHLRSATSADQAWQSIVDFES